MSKTASTLAYYAAFIGLGFVAALFGPTLAGLAANTGATLGSISAILVANSLGRMLGSLTCGRLLDRVPGHPLMAAGFALIALMLVSAPLVHTLLVLVIVFALIGFGLNMIDVGANTLIVWTHGAEVGPYMATLHFTFGLGAFITPLFAARATAISGSIELAYIVVAILMLPFIVWLLRLPSPARPAMSIHVDVGEVNWRLVAMIATFFFFAVGVEMVMSQWTFTYGIAINLDASNGAALLASAFWGAYSLGRLIAIPISRRIAPERMLRVDVLGLAVSGAVLLLGRGVPTLAWVGVFGIGLSTASIFPAMLTFAGRRLNVTGKINGLLFTASTSGSMFFPWVIAFQYHSAYASLPGITGAYEGTEYTPQ